jgi:hypothetical protein
MPPACSICTHEQRNELDRELIGSATIRDIASRYDVGRSSLDRHRRTCLRPKVASAIARREEVSADRLVSYANGILEYMLSGMLRARSQDPPDDHGVRAFAGEARKTVELLARLGHVVGPDAVVNVDARKQVAVFATLTEDEIRAALARADGDVIDGSARELPEAVEA